MEEISKRAWHSAFAPPAPPKPSTTELTPADREALAHVTGLLRAYYQTLLIEPTPERLLGLLDEIDARLEAADRGAVIARLPRGRPGPATYAVSCAQHVRHRTETKAWFEDSL